MHDRVKRLLAVRSARALHGCKKPALRADAPDPAHRRTRSTSGSPLPVHLYQPVPLCSYLESTHAALRAIRPVPATAEAINGLADPVTLGRRHHA